MKARLLILYAAGMLAWNVQAGITYSATPGSIPDGSPVGWSATAKVSDLPPSITDVNVTLNISGGYNGDLYAYLSYGGVLVPLLNRVGTGSGSQPQYSFGYSTAGMNVTLAGNRGGYPDIHTTESPTSGGTYAPDGRQINPLSAPSAFNNAGTIDFSAFNGMNPNTGTWTLFFADLSSGQQSTLGSWSLNITAVPEPVNVALGVLAGLFLVVALARNKHVRNRIDQWRVAVTHWIDAV